jgi:hypothetical protein
MGELERSSDLPLGFVVVAGGAQHAGEVRAEEGLSWAGIDFLLQLESSPVMMSRVFQGSLPLVQDAQLIEREDLLRFFGRPRGERQRLLVPAPCVFQASTFEGGVAGSDEESRRALAVRSRVALRCPAGGEKPRDERVEDDDQETRRRGAPNLPRVE